VHLNYMHTVAHSAGYRSAISSHTSMANQITGTVDLTSNLNLTQYQPVHEHTTTLWGGQHLRRNVIDGPGSLTCCFRHRRYWPQRGSVFARCPVTHERTHVLIRLPHACGSLDTWTRSTAAAAALAQARCALQNDPRVNDTGHDARTGQFQSAAMSVRAI